MLLKLVPSDTFPIRGVGEVLRKVHEFQMHVCSEPVRYQYLSLKLNTLYSLIMLGTYMNCIFQVQLITHIRHTFRFKK